MFIFNSQARGSNQVLTVTTKFCLLFPLTDNDIMINLITRHVDNITITVMYIAKVDRRLLKNKHTPLGFSNVWL